jgi:hypothetical protein
MEIREGNKSLIGDLRLLPLQKSEDPEQYGMKKFEEDQVYMRDGDKQKLYDPTRILRNVHWGQLKLFCSEMFLFLKHTPPTVSDILYIGAAPGEHLFVLNKLFPKFRYHLYDSENFDKRLHGMENIKIHKKYFDDSDIKKWKKMSNFALISDIRTLSYDPSVQDSRSRQRNEDSVWADMKLQEKWIMELRPTVSLIKFRLPFAYDFVLKEGLTREYLNGVVMKQVFNKPTSSETRLIVTDFDKKDWNLVEYEQKMAYHNDHNRNRSRYYNPLNMSKTPVVAEAGLGNDFDSVFLTHMVMEYLKENSGDFHSTISMILSEMSYKKVSLLTKRAGF